MKSIAYSKALPTYRVNGMLGGVRLAQYNPLAMLNGPSQSGVLSNFRDIYLPDRPTTVQSTPEKLPPKAVSTNMFDGYSNELNRANVPVTYAGSAPEVRPALRINQVKRVDELSRGASLSNIASNRGPDANPQFELGNEVSSRVGLGYKGDVPTPSTVAQAAEPRFQAEQAIEKLPKEASSVGMLESASTMDVSPLVAGASIATEYAFNDAGTRAFNEGTISGHIESSNLQQTGHDMSAGIVAGSMIGSTLDEYLGPIGTLAGGAIGGLIGAFSSNMTNRQVNTTGAPVSASSNSLPF